MGPPVVVELRLGQVLLQLVVPQRMAAAKGAGQSILMEAGPPTEERVHGHLDPVPPTVSKAATTPSTPAQKLPATIQETPGVLAPRHQLTAVAVILGEQVRLPMATPGELRTEHTRRPVPQMLHQHLRQRDIIMLLHPRLIRLATRLLRQLRLQLLMLLMRVDRRLLREGISTMVHLRLRVIRLKLRGIGVVRMMNRGMRRIRLVRNLTLRRHFVSHGYFITGFNGGLHRGCKWLRFLRARFGLWKALLC